MEEMGILRIFLTLLDLWIVNFYFFIIVIIIIIFLTLV